jgi:hypothetical protein
MQQGGAFMRNRFRVIWLGLAFLLLTFSTGVAAPKPVYEQCEFSGEIHSFGELVTILTSVAGPWELADSLGNKVPLFVSGNVLGGYLAEGEYWGQVRCIKRQPRFDFDFGPDECTSPYEGDGPPPFGNPDYPDTAHFCPYRLVLLDGIYDRQSDMVQFDSTAEVVLADYSIGPPCEVAPDDPNCVAPGGYTVFSGKVLTVGQNITLQFGTDQEEPEDPKPPKKPKK